ncbi:MAG: tyrosine-type recombinase/integrase, partial [Gammaproteobacteria bacterium]
MSDPSRVRVTGPLTRFAEGFAAALIREGYRRNAAANQLQLMAHLSRWLAPKGLDVVDLTPSVVQRFLAARRAQGYALWRSPKALVPFMEYLRGLGLVPAAPNPPWNPVEELLTQYGRYLLDTRGLAVTSVRGYVDGIRPWVASRLVDGQLDWQGLNGAQINAFVRQACSGRSRGSASLRITALRSLLNYLHLENLIPRPLAAVVPPVAGSRLAGLPRYLESGDVERLLTACDRHTQTGRRDFALLMLLVRLGLRAGEVCSLALDDLDWRAGELAVRGKGHRIERLPLPAEVGEALAAYLRHGRPATAQGRTVFVRVRAPHRPLTSAPCVNILVVWFLTKTYPQGTAKRGSHGRLSARKKRSSLSSIA